MLSHTGHISTPHRNRLHGLQKCRQHLSGPLGPPQHFYTCRQKSSRNSQKFDLTSIPHRPHIGPTLASHRPHIGPTSASKTILEKQPIQRFHFIIRFHRVKMPYKFKRDCPVCGKPDLLYLGDHLRQVHQLQAPERKSWLNVAKFLGSNRAAAVMQGSLPRELHIDKRPTNAPLKRSIPVRETPTATQDGCKLRTKVLPCEKGFDNGEVEGSVYKELLQYLKQQNLMATPVIPEMQRIQNNMDNLLYRTDLSDNDKARQYMQLQNRFLTYKHQLNFIPEATQE